MQRFNTILKHPELNALNARNQQTQTAQKIWEAIAPDNLAQFSHASSIKNQQFTVFADNNVVAAKIKLLLPSLLIKLQKQVCEVTAIRVKVQVKSTPQPKLKPRKKLSPMAVSQLKQLGKKLSGTALGDALDKLIKTAD
ncbi:MAG: DciA family protein [Methylotenera sp.]